MSDTQTITALQDRRQAILDALTATTFTPDQLQELYTELAELALEIGPDVDEIGEAQLYGQR